MRVTILTLVVIASSCNAMIEHIPLPARLQDCFGRHAIKTSIVETVGESIASFCFDQYIWRSAREHGWKGFNITRQAYVWANNLLNIKSMRRGKRQATNLRIRKEYRRLTDQERADFHRAIQLLKMDTSIHPNRYDALSAIHQGIMTTAAHGGPNFLGFHRVYLLMFENALREKVPTVTVPYWDSTLDERMMDPTQSVIFTETFLGQGFGVVNSGPFANWGTLSGPLIRNIGQSGQLFKQDQINWIIARTRLAEITEPNAAINSSLEFLHNQVHLWIDGQMGSLNTAAHDPVFWLHHSYVDYVWELFRQNQRSFGVDPTNDYPAFVNDTMHMANNAMGLSNLRNIDGFNNMYTSTIYTYEQTPTCSGSFPDCGSQYLRCEMRNFRPTCVSADRSAAPVSFPTQSFINQANAMATAVRINTMNVIRTQQMAQLQMASLQRMQLQRQIILRRQQQATQSQGPPVENENPALDDASEAHKVNKRWIMYPIMNNNTNQASMMALKVKQLRPRGNFGVDPRGSAFTQSKINVNTNIQPTRRIMLVRSRNPQIPQNIMNNLQNSTSPKQMMMPQQQTCPTIPMSRGYQNTFNINGRSDINQWVYIPVKVVYQRPPTFGTYSSFPVVNGEAEEREDIYSPNANMKTVLRMGKPASYSRCSAQESGAGKVYINSQGMNYMGTYKEYAVVDHRLSISIATAYVAAKSPEFGSSEVFLSAYDSCGRVCQPYCKMAGMPGFQRCSGAFRITSGLPKLYGMNYGDAVENLWHFGKNGHCPLIAEDNVYIQFYCNFREAWPFVIDPASPAQRPVSLGKSAVTEAPEAPEAPVAKPVSTGITSHKNGPTMARPQVCNVGQGCVVTSDCPKCTNGRSYACAGSCANYASCTNNVHVIKTCPQNTWFNGQKGQCEPGTCLNYNRPNSWWLFQQNPFRQWK